MNHNKDSHAGPCHGVQIKKLSFLSKNVGGHQVRSGPLAAQNTAVLQ